MAVKCYTSGNQGHVGLETFYSHETGLCVSHPDQSNYELEANEYIHCGFRHVPEDKYPIRDMVIYIEGKERARTGLNGSHIYFWWSWCWYVKPPEQYIEFVIEDRYSGKKLLSAGAYVNKEELGDEPTPPIGDEVDYDKIQRGVWEVVNESTQRIVEEIVVSEGLIGDIKDEVLDLKSSTISKIEEGIEESRKGFKGIKEQVEGLKFPTIDNIKEGFLSMLDEFVNALWDRILDRIERRYEK